MIDIFKLKKKYTKYDLKKQNDEDQIITVDYKKKYNNEYFSHKYIDILEDSGWTITEREKPETKEELVLRLLKGDFEKLTGISYDEFQEIYKKLIEHNPEKLI